MDLRGITCKLATSANKCGLYKACHISQEGDVIAANFARGDRGAAIAHGAFLNKIPYVVLRAISDKADGSAHMDYPEFERAAAAHCAKLLENLVSKI